MALRAKQAWLDQKEKRETKVSVDPRDPRAHQVPLVSLAHLE